MPKLIKGIKNRILENAKMLFETESFEKVEMKIIAENSGIAVGTLYNYFPGKKELFLISVKSGWEELFNSLKGSINDTLTPKENLKRLLTDLYILSEPKRKMWAGFFSEKTRIPEKEIDEIQLFLQKMLSKLNLLFLNILEKMQIPEKSNFPNFTKHKDRISFLIMDMIVSLLLKFGEDSSGNLEFINNLVDYLF